MHLSTRVGKRTKHFLYYDYEQIGLVNLAYVKRGAVVFYKHDKRRFFGIGLQYDRT